MTKQSTRTTLPAKVPALPAPNVLFAGFFDLVAQSGLAAVTPEKLAQQLNIPAPVLRQTYPSSGHIMRAFSEFIDQAMQDAVPYDPQSSKREIYFDLIMARLDALEPYRNGIARLLRDMPRRPDLTVQYTRQLYSNALQLMLDTADDNYPAWQVPLKKAALLALCLRILQIWTKDQSADLSKTMASLDNYLDKAEYFAGRITKMIAL
jgi:ubiquinone biosynthesis protein COQ9